MTSWVPCHLEYQNCGNRVRKDGSSCWAKRKESFTTFLSLMMMKDKLYQSWEINTRYSIVQKSWIRNAQISFFVLANFRRKFARKFERNFAAFRAIFPWNKRRYFDAFSGPERNFAVISEMLPAGKRNFARQRTAVYQGLIDHVSYENYRALTYTDGYRSKRLNKNLYLNCQCYDWRLSLENITSVTKQ